MDTELKEIWNNGEKRTNSAQWRNESKVCVLKHFIIQKMHKYIIRRYN